MATITPAAAFPVTGAQATTPSYSGTFIPTLWSGRLNAKFFAATTFGSVANTNWEGEISGKGDKVIINNIPDVAINPYSAGMTLATDVPAPETIELPIDQGYYFNVAINDVIAYQSNPKLMDVFTGTATEQLKVQIDSECWAATFNQGHPANMGATAGVISGSYNLGTDTAPVALDPTNILSNILALSSVLDEQNMPETGRALIISPSDRQILLQSNIAQAYFTGDSTSPMRNGQIGELDRFKVYVSNLLPRAAADQDWSGNAQTGTAARHAIIACHESALTFASQISKVETIQNPNDFGQLLRGLNVYGRAVSKPEGLALLIAAG